MDFTGKIKNDINELSKLSDDELTAELSRHIAMKKQDGTLGDIEKLARTIAPFLDNEQKLRLARVLQNMKKG